MTAADNPIISVQNLVRSYGDLTAVDHVSFDVYPGEIFGMIGLNGAGKTTTIECIEGLRTPDSGSIQVLGMDPEKDGYSLRKRIGVQLQSSALPERMKVVEALDLFASFYPQTVSGADLLKQLNLESKANTFYGKLSGGQKQRLFIALALVNNPELVFLDELTTGLDPQARRSMWDLVLSIREQGRSVFLTTHFMQEAERLCDRVAILDRGRIVDLDTPENLIAGLDNELRITFQVLGHCDTGRLNSLAGVNRVELVGDRITIHGTGDRLLSRVVNAIDDSDVTYRNLHTEQATLEDVFLASTGKTRVEEEV